MFQQLILHRLVLPVRVMILRLDSRSAGWGQRVQIKCCDDEKKAEKATRWRFRVEGLGFRA